MQRNPVSSLLPNSQAPLPTALIDQAYRQQFDQAIKRSRRHSRRQFLATATGLCAGSAMLLGGLTLYGQPNLISSIRGSNQKGTTCIAPATTSTNQSLATNKPLTVLNVCQLNTSINFFPVYVAQQKGYFTEQGLLIPPPDIMQVGSKMTAALDADKYDVGAGVITDAFNWARFNSSAKIIGSVMNGYIVDIVVGKQFELDMGVSANSPLADRINALQGKKIGITGPQTGTQALLVYLFRQQGLDASKDIKQVSLGSNNKTALDSLKAGKVDALSFFSPIGQAAQAQGIGDIFISPVRGDVPGLRGDVHGVIYTKQSVIDTKPQALMAYIRALNKAEIFIQQNPKESQVLLNKYLNLGQNVTNAVYAATSLVVATNPLITQDSYNVAGQFHIQAGFVSMTPSYNKLVATDLINSALNASC